MDAAAAIPEDVEDEEEEELVVAMRPRSHSFPSCSVRRFRVGLRPPSPPTSMTSPVSGRCETPMPVRTVDRWLARVHREWSFDAFVFVRCSTDAVEAMPTLCLHLFRHFGLLAHFGLDALLVQKFFLMVARGYRANNPYHNAVHALDVTQAMACFLNEARFAQCLSPAEMLAALVAAATHDLDHPGCNEKFLHALARCRHGDDTSVHPPDSLAFLTQATLNVRNTEACSASQRSQSVLEKHHWRSALSMMRLAGLEQALGRDGERVKTMVRELILATDISRQPEFLGRMERILINNEACSGQEKRLLLLQIGLKCADISNPCRPWSISRRWSRRACEEFFRQGDQERRMAMQVSPLCDRTATTVAKVQIGFYRFVACPLFDHWNRLLGSPLSRQMLRHLQENQVRWEVLASGADRSSESSTTSSTATVSSSSNVAENIEHFSMLNTESSDEHRRHSLPIRLLSGDELQHLQMAHRRGLRRSHRHRLNRRGSKKEEEKENLPVNNKRNNSRRGSAPCALVAKPNNKGLLGSLEMDERNLAPFRRLSLPKDCDSLLDPLLQVEEEHVARHRLRRLRQLVRQLCQEDELRRPHVHGDRRGSLPAELLAVD